MEKRFYISPYAMDICEYCKYELIFIKCMIYNPLQGMSMKQDSSAERF